MIRVFIGYDEREAIAYHVLSHSIHRRASAPVSITPLALSQLASIHSRPRDPLQSTDFAFTRFLVPYLCNYQGWAIFMDCDMLCLDDIAKLWAMRDGRYAVMCVKHDHQPREETKFLGAIQTAYPCKNWSSVMLMNCNKLRMLLPEVVNSASGRHLHQFHFIDGMDIGDLLPRWNHLVGYDAPRDDVALAHYTIGGPWFKEYENCEYSVEWCREVTHMMRCDETSDKRAQDAGRDYAFLRTV